MKKQTPLPTHSNRRVRAGFARAAVFAEFGYRSGRAIDYENFADRLPNELPAFSPGVRSK